MQRNIRDFFVPIVGNLGARYYQRAQEQVQNVAQEWIDSGLQALAAGWTADVSNHPDFQGGPPAKKAKTEHPTTTVEEVIDEPDILQQAVESAGIEEEAEPSFAQGNILRGLLEQPMASEQNTTEAMAVDAPVAASGAGGGGGFSTGASGGGPQEQGGMPLFPEGVFTGPNKTTKIFTKAFYLKLYANGLYETIDATTGAVRVLGWQTVIPYQALSSYMTAEEYLECIRDGSYGKIKQAKFQLEFQDIRTPFGTNTMDQAEANGNLQFEIQEFHGIERYMPFQTVTTDYPISAENIKAFDNFGTWIKKLYGTQPFSVDETPRKKTEWPAEMYQRGLDYRPLWQFSKNTGTEMENGTGILYRDYNQHVTSIPFGKYCSRRVNTNTSKMNGVFFNKIYKPKNGLITAAPTAFDLKRKQLKDGRFTRINQPIRMRDTNAANPPPYQDPSKPQYQSNWYSDAITVLTDIQKQTDVASYIDTVTSKEVQYPDDGTYSNDAISICMYDPRMGPTGKSAGITPCQIVEQTQCTGQDLNTAVRENRGSGGNTVRLQEMYNFAKDNFVNGINRSTKSFITDFTGNEREAEDNVRDVVGYGYANDLQFYTRATLENFSVWTSRNQPPIHEMPSWMIGIVPKTTGPLSANDDIVNATATFLCKTAIEIEIEHDPTLTTNFAYDYDNTRYMDPIIDATRANDTIGRYLYGGKWTHNEKDVFIREDKNWALDYARAAKMGFVEYNDTDPTI